MKDELNLVKEFHMKFHQPILTEPSLIPQDRSENRHRLMQDEVSEYIQEVIAGNVADIAKELADILYTVYGTVLEHGLQEKMAAIFREVHSSNMSKDYHEYKMIKGTNYFKADVTKILNKKE